MDRTALEATSQLERIILLALERARARGETGTSHLWLQKVAFLFIQRMEELAAAASPAGTGYVAYDYGPYSEELAGAVETLCDDKLVSIEPNRTIHVTPAGRAVVEQLELTKVRAVQAMDSILQTVEGLTENELMLYVYVTNPEWASESKLRHLLQDKRARRALALKLYRQGRVTSAKASQIAGIALEKFAAVAAAE